MADVFLDTGDEVAAELSKFLRLASRLGNVSEDRPTSVKARKSYDKALRETVTYLATITSNPGSYNRNEEGRLSSLWSEASVAISEFDPNLANRCFIKGQGWLDPNVWNDQRYKNYRIGIDDMREALMTFNSEQYVKNTEKVPDWYPKAGVGFAIATFASLFYFLIGPDLSSTKKIIFDAWMAFCVAASAAFLGGTAVSTGTLKIPFMKDAPVKFSAVGGISVFIVIFLILTAANR
jgi:hypothetical protein